MGVTKEKINSILEVKQLSKYKVCRIINCPDSTFNEMINGSYPLSDKVVEKISPILEVSEEEIKGWILADKYPKEVIELAIQTKREVCHPALDAGSNKQAGKIPHRQVGAYNYGSRNRLVMQPVRNDREKLILTIKIDEILKEKGLSRTQLSKLIKYDQSSVNRMITGKNSLSQSVIERISPILEVNENTIKSWVVADKYTIEILQNAINELG